MNLRLNIILLFFLLGTFHSYAQETREDIEKQAESYFKKEQFIEATPLYLRLLSLEPRNPSYNYKYGTCLLFNSEEKKSAFKYLNYAVQKSGQVDDEAYFYLGKAYHLTFQFDNAIKYYKIYKEIAGSRALAKLDVDHQIQMCKNGKSLLVDINDVIVLNKTKIDKESFFRIYNLKDIGGEILVTEEFQTKNDRKRNHTPIIHFPANSNRVYYSSYGDKDNKDIYVRTQLPNGKWSLPQPVLGKVNTSYDEDYPYMDRHNNYLYFSSKGHNSMGGFDVFRCHYNPVTNNFGEPENMDIPISSPDNDFLYMVDSLERHAYFASQRESESDQIDVYNIRVERVPVNWVILKGYFSSELDPLERKLSIHIDNNSGAPIGDFVTTTKGDYLIVLPKGGEYKFTMKVGNEDKEYKQSVDVPYLDKIRPLKQRIIQTTEEENPVVVIKNLFDATFDNESTIIAQALEFKSKLEVNKDQYDLDSLDLLSKEKSALDAVGLSGFTYSEILVLVQNKVNQLTERNETTDELIKKGKSSLVKTLEEAENHLKKADSLMKAARNTNNKGAAEKMTRQAQDEIQSVSKIQDDVHEIKDVIDSLALDKKKGNNYLSEAKELLMDLKNVDSKDKKGFVSALSRHQTFVNEELLEETPKNAGEEYIAQIDKRSSNRDELNSKQNHLMNERLASQNEVNRLNEAYDNTRSKGKKKQLSLELAQAQSQLETINSEIDYVETQLKKQEKVDKKRKWIAKIVVGDIQENLPDDKEIQEKSDALGKDRDRVENENNSFAIKNGIDLSKESSIQADENIEKTEKVYSSNELLEKADPDYEREIEELNTAVENGEESKDAIVKRIRKAIIQVDDLTSSMMKEKEDRPDAKQIDSNISELSLLKRQLQRKIEDLNSEIEKENELANVQEDEREPQDEISKIEEDEGTENTNPKNKNEPQDRSKEDIAINNQETDHQEKKDNITEDIDREENNGQVSGNKEGSDLNHDESSGDFKDNEKSGRVITEDIDKHHDENQGNVARNNSDDNKDKDIVEHAKEHPNLTSSSTQRQSEQEKDDHIRKNKESTEEENNKNNKQEKPKHKEVQSETEDPVGRESNLYGANEHQKEEIRRLNETKLELMEAERSDPELSKNKKHQKQLAHVENEIVQQKNDVLDAAIVSMKSASSPNDIIPNEKEEVELSFINAQYSKIEIDELIQEADQEKNLEKKRALLDVVNKKQQEALEAIQKSQSTTIVNQQLDSIISSNDYKNIDPNKVTVTRDDINKEQIKLGVKLLEIKSQINEINSLLPNAKRKDKERLIQQRGQLEKIQKQIKSAHNQRIEATSKAEQESIVINNKGVDVDAINNELSYEDEVAIAQSKMYKKLFNSSNQLNQTQFELQVKLEQLDAEKSELKQLRDMKREHIPLSNKDKEELKKQLVKIDQTKSEITNLKSQITSQQDNIKSFISEDRNQQDKIENMIARDVAPINEAPSLPVMMTGLITTNDSKTQYSDNNPIPISNEQPKGLVFRVQIGAFAHPVPNNTFKEFSPISGKVVRPGLVRYMAGYFGDRNNANAARDKIRTLGYSDAFVVAYCDGERIPVYRAMQLMASGACVPKIKTNDNAIVSEHDVSHSNDESFDQKLDAYSYNKGTNAAKADVAESKMGLYYTVQVGVYNTPVPAAQLKNISPLVTKRLPNGQIRYSSGIFNSIIEAKPKQNEAIDRGITDAFITAYYQGKRISLGEAKKLIDDNGSEILELKNPTISSRNKIINRSTPEDLLEEQKPFLANKKLQSIMISKLTFSSYPTQILNRYNADGQLFYYDSITQHIRSFVFEGNYTAPPFKDEFEELEFYNNIYPVLNKDAIKRKEAIGNYDKKTILLKVNIIATDLNPDLMRTIFNAPFNKVMSTSNSELTIVFYAFKTQEREALINHLQVVLAQFGATNIIKSIRQYDTN